MSALLAYQLDLLIKQIAVLVHHAGDPAVAARWCLQELAARTGLEVVVLGHHAAASERLRVAGDAAVDALRHGLADPEDAQFTEEATCRLVGALMEELTAYALGDDYCGSEDALEQAWGELVTPTEALPTRELHRTAETLPVR